MTMHEYFLGQILWSPDIIVKTVIEPDDFPTSRDKLIFEAMRKINYKGEIINELSIHKETDIDLMEIVRYKGTDIVVSQWKYYQGQIIEQSRQLKIRKAAEKILNSHLSADDMIAEFNDSISVAGGREGDVIRTLSECVDISLAEFDERAKSNAIPGVSTGFRRLDELFGGFQRRRLYYIGARPSQGKSALLMNFAVNFNRPLVFFTAESAEVELSNRMMVKEGHLNSKQFMNGTLSGGDYERLKEVGENLRHKDIHVVYRGNMPLYRLVALAYEFKRTKRIEGIFVDYIQLLDPTDKSIPRNEQVSEMSKRLKQLAVDLDIPVICAAQLRRDAEGGKPKLSDFSDSTQIERDADVAMMIYNIEDQKTGELEQSYICVEKNRDGEVKDVAVDFHRGSYYFQESIYGEQNYR